MNFNVKMKPVFNYFMALLLIIFMLGSAGCGKKESSNNISTGVVAPVSPTPPISASTPLTNPNMDTNLPTVVLTLDDFRVFLNYNRFPKTQVDFVIFQPFSVNYQQSSGTCFWFFSCRNSNMWTQYQDELIVYTPSYHGHPMGNDEAGILSNMKSLAAGTVSSFFVSYNIVQLQGNYQGKQMIFQFDLSKPMIANPVVMQTVLNSYAYPYSQSNYSYDYNYDDSGSSIMAGIYLKEIRSYNYWWQTP